MTVMEMDSRKKRLEEIVSKLRPDEAEFLQLMCRRLGHTGTSWDALSEAGWALRWELVWRLRPELPYLDDLISEVHEHPNPFPLRAALPEGEGNRSARELLERAAEIEECPGWNKPSLLTERYLKLIDSQRNEFLLAEKGTRATRALSVPTWEEQSWRATRVHASLTPKLRPAREAIPEVFRELEAREHRELMEAFTRLLLRGRLEDAVLLLKTYRQACTSKAPTKTVPDDQPRELSLLVDDFAPIAAFAYLRARAVDLKPLADLINSVVKDFAVESSRAQLPTSLQQELRAQCVANWVESLCNANKVGYRD